MISYQGMEFLEYSLLCMVLLLGSLEEGYSQISFEAAFGSCHRNTPEFDNCIKDALNAVRPYFKTGIPEWNIPTFDPFFSREVIQNMGTSHLHYNLKLINVTEAGWTQSEVTNFRSDFEHNLIKFTQYFPAKFLKGMYEFYASILGNPISTNGYWNLALYGFVQTTTISREPRLLENGTYVYDTPLKVMVSIQTTKNMRLHVSNLLGGRKEPEMLLDKIINSAWPPGFIILKPLINDLVSTAFTDIFDRVFRDFKFDQIIN